MIPERWQEIKAKLHEALGLEPAQRYAYLNQVGASNPELRHELESLLASHDQAGTAFLNTSAAKAVLARDTSAAPAIPIGRRIGPYQIIEEIGAGGMGEVYRAFRADDQYQKQVAIKLVRAGQDSGFVLSRFKNERQILANLDHPNIARLLDGGTTDEGVPYFVMELIEGEPIDEYCANRTLSVNERLKLFLQVCSAVQYAHQRLIIHRDIKPGNILVTSDGTPKLLDFGIAKLLDTDAVEGRFEPTLTIFRVLTPGYASPEQVKGEPITTVSDVYSLGVVLYELLTGRHPYRHAKSTAQEIARAVCEVQPEKPSTAVRQSKSYEELVVAAPPGPALPGQFGHSAEKLSKTLRGDLDNILLMALRKEPQRRYLSVEQFAEDIRRHLENLPVIARKDTVRYRTAKFIRRNKVTVAAGAIVVLTLSLGMAITLHESRVARAQQQRAEQHFKDVRELANSLMFDVHDSIENLPGSTAARKLLVQRALRYLDRLSHDTASDTSLRRELATAYEKVGAVQGDPFGANLGDTQGALDSYRKSLEIRQALCRAVPHSVEEQIALAHVEALIAEILANRLGPPGLIEMEQALATADRALQRAPNNRAALIEVRREHGFVGLILMSAVGNYQGALDHFRSELQILEALLKETPDDTGLRGNRWLTQMYIAATMARMGLRKEAFDYFPLRRSDDDSEIDANNAEERRIAAWGRAQIGDVLLMNGDVAAAFDSYQRELKLLAPLKSADPVNSVLDYDLAAAYANVGNTLTLSGHQAEGLEMLEEASKMFEKQIAHDPAYAEPQWSLARTHVWVDEALVRDGRRREAAENYGRHLVEWQNLAEYYPAAQAVLAGIHARLAALGADMREPEQAAQEYRQALVMAESILETSPNILEAQYVLADASSGLGDLEQRLASNKTENAQQRTQRWKDARDWYQRSLKAWQAIHNPGFRTPMGVACGNPKRVSQQIARCDAALARLRSSPTSTSSSK